MNARDSLLSQSVAHARGVIEDIEPLKKINSVFSFYSGDGVEQFSCNTANQYTANRLYHDRSRNVKYMYMDSRSTPLISGELTRVLEQETAKWLGFQGLLPIKGMSGSSTWGPRELREISDANFYAIIPLTTMGDGDAQVFVNRNFSINSHEISVEECDEDDRTYFKLDRGDVLFVNSRDYALGITMTTGVFNWLLLGINEVT